MRRSYYSDTISNFLREDETKILGYLATHHAHALEDLQKNAWQKQIKLLKSTLKDFEEGFIHFEFSIPRMGKRADNVLIINDFIFVLEFKVGDMEYQKYAIEQVVDYCLDLQNFHEGSHYERLVPILVATKADPFQNNFYESNNLFEPIKANQDTLSAVLRQVLTNTNGRQINAIEWENSVYKPTPTIIEAAQALYKGHNVREISRHDAGAINLSRTTQCINRIIERAKSNGEKSICFLTGVPGAGKTLAGLNIANERMKADKNEHSVFLSGNGPLVDVLREALARDSVKHAKETGLSSSKKKEKDRAVKFIQNIHHFRDDNLISHKAPVEKVVVFDEAQRAWTKEKASSFMKIKKGLEDFNKSEPAFLIEVMDRHNDWCVIICLIGGGQEINTGEAGVSEWIAALQDRFPKWKVHFSNLMLTDENYLYNSVQQEWLKEKGNVQQDLHLSVSVRSFRSEKISALMQEILNVNTIEAKELCNTIKDQYPIYITRNLTKAKKWLRAKARGSERIGIVASSGARRLRPLGIDVKNEISAPDWFLNFSDDVRSSNYLEDVATEFDIQGLEIDYVCLAWDINFYFANGHWHYQKFEGTSWRKIHTETDRGYLLNTYRVLLTRARQGLVIFVPEGDDMDRTRLKNLYDGIYHYLLSCGIKEI
ncbi:MAG: DUF2075 domain-containing protein [Sphingobacteriales bacterium]|nr:DUF2075 domain-containing protein [Sphingobacteriales bacterium]